MYLRDIAVHISPRLLAGRSGNDFRANINNVEEIFRYYLPRKYNLHGQGKINIWLGADQTPQYLEVSGVADYRIPDFDLAEYLKLSDLEQSLRILAIIRSTLLDLATRFSADSKPIETATGMTKESSFELVIPLKKLTRTHKSKKFRVAVCTRIRRGGIDVWAECIDRTGSVLKRTTLLTDSFSYQIYHSCRHSRWNGSKLEILGSSKQVSFSIDCEGAAA